MIRADWDRGAFAASGDLGRTRWDRWGSAAVGVVAASLATLLRLFAELGGVRVLVVDLHVGFDHAEAVLDDVELGGGDDVFVARRKDRGDFFLRSFDAIGRRRMGGENLRDRAGLLLFIGSDFFEEGDEGVRIVAGLVHVLQAEVIGFAFINARELQEGHRDRELHALIDGVASPGVRDENHRGDHGHLDHVLMGGLLGAVARADVGDFVSHHAGEFGFFVGVENQAAVDVEEAAREREGVDDV